MVYAGFWKRLAAAWIDCLVTMAIWMILGYFYAELYLDDIVTSVLAEGVTDLDAMADEINHIYGAGQVYVLLISLAGAWIYHTVFESSEKQGTLGKLAVGIKVTDLHGNRIGFFRASGRYFAKYISATFIGIGYVMVAFTKRKQGLHDMMAGCLVVRQDVATPDSDENREDRTVD